MAEHILEVVRDGLVPYQDALLRQRQLAEERIAGTLPHDVLWLLEHPPVVTLGRTSHAEHVIRGDGVDVVEVERGGDVTYHGPGQLVGYPIIDLREHTQDLHWYLRTLERALITALAALRIPAERNPGFTGVWTRGRKIASIGIHVKQWVTWHGFALNVTTDLSAFDRIVPCGIPGVVMTSVLREGGDTGSVPDAVIHGIADAFGLTAREASRELVEEIRQGKPFKLPAA
jgi:lipoate-protein ligase B